MGAVAEARLSDGMVAAMPLRRRGASRARILAATRELLRRRSYDVLTMDAVAEAARLTRRTIYHQFMGRQSLYRASREALARAVAAQLPRSVVTAATPRDAVLRFATQTLAALSGDDGSELLLSLVRDTEDRDWLAALYDRECRARAVTTLAQALPDDDKAAAQQFMYLLEALALARCLAGRGGLNMAGQLGPLVDALLGQNVPACATVA